MSWRVLDLFCGAGGAAMGLHRAWPNAKIVGVDISPQKNYPFDFVQADAMTFPLDGFDFIWASPPCQAYCPGAHYRRATGTVYADLVSETRDRLETTGKPYAIENVLQAPLRRTIVLDGTMFRGLKVIRRRAFETNFFLLAPTTQIRPNLVSLEGWSTVAGGGRNSGVPIAANAWHTADAKRKAMGIDWMNRTELAQAIPPAYSEFIARQVPR